MSNQMHIQSAFEQAGNRFLDNDAGGGIRGVAYPAALTTRMLKY
jgi:hypothetical protein